MQEVDRVSAQREELYETIRNMPDAYVEKILKMVNLFLEPTLEEREKWWTENVDSQGESEIALSSDDLDVLKDMDLKPWDDLKDKI